MPPFSRVGPGKAQHASRAHPLISSLSALKTIGCIVLREVHFLNEPDWLPWNRPQDWQPNIVAYKGYDLLTGPGLLLKRMLQDAEPAELAPTFRIVEQDSRTTIELASVLREG